MKNTWRFDDKEINYISEVLGSGFVSGTSGSMNNAFETAFAKHENVPYAITFNSGTSTLHAALFAAGVGYGDEVIMPALSVISNAIVTLALNAVPVFADIDPKTFNIDPADIERKITPKTKAIQVVPLYGLPCDYDAILDIAARHGLVVINDAAQAFGARYKGRGISEICPITSFSLENSKHISTGDGGIIVTKDEELAIKIRKFGSLGYAAMKSGDGRIRVNKDVFQDPSYKRHDQMSLNYRMPEVAAAMGLAQLEKFDQFIQMHIDSARYYLEAVDGCDFLRPQAEPEGYENSWWCFTAAYEHPDVSWQDFRKKYMELGGDGIYAAWALQYQELLFSSGDFRAVCPPVYENVEYLDGLCPVAEDLQAKLMQFPANYNEHDEMQQKAEALAETIRYFS